MKTLCAMVWTVLLALALGGCGTSARDKGAFPE